MLHEQISPFAPRYRVFLFGRLRFERNESNDPAEEPCYQAYTPRFDRQSPWRALAYILTQPGRQTYRDNLIEAFWLNDPVESARHACSVALSQIRQELLDYRHHPLLSPRKADENKVIHLAGKEHIWIDLDAFTNLITQAQLADRQGRDALALWERAYALSRGEFLLDERYQDWCRSLRERVAGDQRLCMLRLAQLYSEQGRQTDEEFLLRQFLNDSPHDEDVLSRLVAVLLPQGRFREALRWGQRTIEILEEEGLEAMEQTKDLMKHLQTAQRPGSPSLPTLAQDILRTRVSALTPPPESSLFDQATQFAATIIGLVSQWQGRATECASLQARLSKEFAMFEHDALPHLGEEYPLSRRQALAAIAALPYGVLAAAKSTGTEIVPEAILPQCTAAITSCWSIMQHREFGLVQQALAHCLPALTALTHAPSPHQQVAASLAAQGNLLLSLVTLHTYPAPQSFRQRLLFSKQAMELTIPLADPTLRILSLTHIGASERDLGNTAAMVAAYEEAALLSNHELVPLTLRRAVLIALAKTYAQAGQVQQALQSYGKVKTELPPDAEIVPLYLQDSGFFYEGLKETMMFGWLGKQTSKPLYYQRAWESIEETEELLPTLSVPERYRVESINQKALVALRLDKLDQFVDLSLQGIQGAKTLQSEKRRQEIVANWKEARKVWPHESKIAELADILIE